MDKNYLEKQIKGLQDMCNNVIILYNEHAKGNQELTNLANLTYYILWNYLKSLTALKILFSASTQYEQDFAKGQLCVTINECTKHIIGFSKQREESFWNQEMANFIYIHQKYKEQYIKLKENWVAFADGFDGNAKLKDFRDIATHGDKKIENLIKLHELSVFQIGHYLNEWEKIMLPTAHYIFTCFENECQQEMNNK